MGLLSAILALLKAIPALGKIIDRLFSESKEQRERAAQNRLVEKDAAVDDAIAESQRRMRERKAGQQQTPDAKN